jgi:hypothetical protein
MPAQTASPVPGCGPAVRREVTPIAIVPATATHPGGGPQARQRTRDHQRDHQLQQHHAESAHLDRADRTRPDEATDAGVERLHHGGKGEGGDDRGDQRPDLRMISVPARLPIPTGQPGPDRQTGQPSAEVLQIPQQPGLDHQDEQECGPQDP